MSSSKTVELRTGAAMPAIGFGTWCLKRQDMPSLIRSAIQTGYRHLDCAAIYENEAEVGATLRSLYTENIITRPELFITSKLWCTMMQPDRVEAALDRTLTDLQTEYVDLYLIHWPMCFETDAQGRAVSGSDGKKRLGDSDCVDDVWRAMNAMVQKGKARAVGVSNFTVARLRSLIASTGLTPAVVQVELHPYLPQDDLLAYCRAEGIAVEAYSPLGSGRDPRLLDDACVRRVAEQEGVSPAQVLISWALMRGTVPLARTAKAERLAENLHVKELSPGAFEAVSAITTRYRYIDSASWTGCDVFAG